MNTLVKCDCCGKAFDFVTAGIRKTVSGDYEVEYLTCPHCLHREQILTTDTELREMIGKRKTLSRKVQLAKNKHFTLKTMKKYQNERDAVARKSREKAAALKATGNEILAQLGGERH